MANEAEVFGLPQVLIDLKPRELRLSSAALEALWR